MELNEEQVAKLKELLSFSLGSHAYGSAGESYITTEEAEAVASLHDELAAMFGVTEADQQAMSDRYPFQKYEPTPHTCEPGKCTCFSTSGIDCEPNPIAFWDKGGE